MINFSVEHMDKKKIVTVKGSLTIEQVDKLKDMLLEMKSHSDNIVVNLANVETLHATCLQVLCSAHKTYLQENKVFEISMKCSEVFNQTVSNSGFAQHKGCKHDKNESCLWIRWADR